jgi:hypothetical protein
MGTTSKNSESTYAGFLNGYIAGNLSANSQELHFHSDKIFSFIKDLRLEVSKWELPPEQRKKMDDVFDAFNLLLVPDNTINNYIKLGDAIYELISYILLCKPNVPSTTNFILKKIIYHFLNIAKTSKYSNITKQAKRIAEKFES